MATVAEILATVASLQNDTAADVYTQAVCLPYLNIALRALQEEFELNDIPVTQEVSTVIPINAGVSVIGFATTPALPTGLVEIKQVWESPRSQSQWLRLSRRDFLPHYLESDAKLSQLLIWAWINQEIRLLPSNANNDLKLDYLRTLFVPITISQMSTPITIINSQSYLEFKTAALCSMFIGENETRAATLENQAQIAIERVLGINVKGRQSVRTRRRPFRAGYKSRTWA